MRRVILFLATLGVGSMVFWFLISTVGWQEVWKPLQALSSLKVVVIFLLTGGFFLLGVLRWHSILRHQGCAISLFDVGKTYLAGLPFLFFVPMFPFANELFRASSLQRQHGIDFVKGMASVIIDRILELTSSLFVVLLGGVIFLLFGNHISYSFRMVGIIAFVGLWFFALSLLYIRLFQKKSIVRIFQKGNGKIERVEGEVFQFFHLQNPFFWTGVYTSLGKSLVGILRAWAIIFFFGKGFAILSAITVHSFYYLAVLVPIPVSLGSHEALQAAAFGAFGLGAGTGAAFALAIRAAEVSFAIAGLAFAFHLGLRLLGNAILQRGRLFFRDI